MMNLSLRTLFALSLVLFVGAGCADRDPVVGGGGSLSGRPYFQVFTAENGDHYFRFRAANHQTILASQGYSSRSAALGGLLSVLDNGENTDSYELRTARNGESYFVLLAGNGRVIGMSEMYASRSNAYRGLTGVARNLTRYLDWRAERTGERFDVFRGEDGRFYFNLHAGNGEIVLSSQGYETEAAALNGTFSVTENGLAPDAYELSESADGGAYFNVVAGNGQVIATSEVYSTMSNARRAVDGVMGVLEVVELL